MPDRRPETPTDRRDSPPPPDPPKPATPSYLYGDPGREFLDDVAHAFGIDRFVDWLARKLNR